MPKWLLDSMATTSSFTASQLIVRLLVSAVYGGLVALIYRASHGRLKSDATVMTTTLVLLSILIAMVSMVVGDSVARAFSLVGALSIVRFRTVVEDTRDTAFVIFAVIVGMAAGAGLLYVPLVGIPIVAGISIWLGQSSGSLTTASQIGPAESTLTIRLGLGHDPDTALAGTLAKHLESYRLNAVETARQGLALEMRYFVRLRSTSTMAAVVAELNQIEGVQSVDLQA